MNFREFFPTISLFLLLIAKANAENSKISKNDKVTLNLGNLVIEVTSPKGRENILNTNNFYDKWQNVDDITYWESIYGSMDNIPAFEDLPGISGDTFFLENVKKSDEEISIPEKSVINFKDRCEWINPFYPKKKWSTRQKREISIPEVESEDDLKIKPKTFLILHGESGKLSQKSEIHSTPRSDLIFNKLGRKNIRSFKTDNENSKIYYCNPSDDIIDCGLPLKFVDSAIKGGESVNTRFESRELSQVIANEPRQLEQAKHNVIDLGLGGRQAIGLASLNNAATDCSRDGVNIAEGNIHGSIEVVGNSVLDTNSGIINKYTRSVTEYQPSLAIEPNNDAIDTIKKIIDTDIDQPEVVCTNLKENNDKIAPDSKLKFVAKDAKIVPILDKSENVEQPQVISEDCSKEKNINDHLETVGAKLEEKKTEIIPEVKETPVIIEDNITNSEAIEPIFDTEKSEAIEPILNPEKSEAIEPISNPEKLGAVEPIFDTEKSEAIESISNPEKSGAIEPISNPEKSGAIEPISNPEKSGAIEPISNPEKSETIEPISNPEKSETIEPISNSEKSKAEIVGTSLKINPTLNTKVSTDINKNIDIGKKHREKNPRHFRRFDLSCECFGPSEEFESEEFYSQKYQNFNDDTHHYGIHDKNFVWNKKSNMDIESSKFEVEANFQKFTKPINSRFDDKIHTSNGHLHTGMKSSLDPDSHLDIAKEKRIIAENERSKIEAYVKKENEKLDEKICEAVCDGIEDSMEDRSWPSSRFDDAYEGRSEYYQREFTRFSGQDEAPYICDNCRKRFYERIESECPICGKFDQRPIKKQRQFLSTGTMHHFDGPKQHFKRTANNENGSRYNHHINLDANCTGDAKNLSPECQAMDYDLQIPQDGNPVPLGFVRRHLSHGHDIAMDMHDRARSLVEGGLQPSPHTPSMLNLYNNKVPDYLVKLNEQSELTLVGTKLLQQKLSVDYNITPNTFLEFLNNNGFRVTGDRICKGRHKRCDGYNKFRSHDGSCNNIFHPTWGQSNRAFARILPARYSDGIHGMPVSVTGAELPNPRKLSVKLYSRNSNPDPELTLAVVQWGQTLAHDLARQVMDQTTKGGIECCGNNGKSQLPKSLQHHSCAPISISPRDKFYSSHGQRCMNFVRAMTVTREDCTLGPADQLNGATSFLDCSTVYGVDKNTSDELREFFGGRMKVEFRSGRWMLPTMRNRSNFCDIWTLDDVCYRSGDPRTNQNPQLVILQTLFVREHNRIANGLSALNPEWKDERIFQESRRIVIAEYQHITYNEWLPLLLGKRYCRRHGIIRTKPGMSNEYDELVNPSTIIGFTSGAFRSLHSMIDGDLGLCNVNGEIVDNLRLSDHFFRPRVIEKNHYFEHLVRGLTMQRMQKQNMNFHPEITEFLFRSRNDYGMDLAAIDIQRGRDHGVPSYNAYRKICRLQRAQNFDDLSEEISWENIEKLRRVYAHVDDIDLIVGATMENRVSGSRFGPTNRCLIGEQFYRSRVGDRYFYDNKNSPYSFTPEQFDEITKVTLSRLMCDMGGAVGVVQRHAFRSISSKNPLIPCENLPKLDLKYWID